MVRDFNFLLPTDVRFGCGVRKGILECVNALGIKKPCIVIDSFLISSKYGQELKEKLPNAAVFSDVIANPNIETISKCTKFCKDNDCDGLIALGGGSSIDIAKATSVVIKDNNPIDLYLDGKGEDKLEIKETLPIIAIPTTFGTGSEVSQFAVITDENTKRKDSITSSKIYPVYSLIDPEVSYELPRNLTISTGLDVLSHAIESLTGKLYNSLTELMAREAIRIIFEYLPKCLDNDKKARNEVAFASMLAGIAMSHCCGTLPHGMGCPLSGHCNVPHGLACGVIQIPTIEIVGKKCHEQLEILMKYIDSNFKAEDESCASKALIKKIKTLFDELGIDGTLKDFNLTDEKIKAMVPDAKIHGCTGLTMEEIDENTIEKIYQSLK